jgi:hypothetical protein
MMINYFAAQRNKELTLLSMSGVTRFGDSNWHLINGWFYQSASPGISESAGLKR